MDGCTESKTTTPRSFRSPWHVLARSFEKSRDRWKRKHQELKQELKAFRTRVRDLVRSRDRWRARAEQLEHELHELHKANGEQATESPPAPSRPELHTTQAWH